MISKLRAFGARQEAVGFNGVLKRKHNVSQTSPSSSALACASPASNLLECPASMSCVCTCFEVSVTFLKLSCPDYAGLLTIIRVAGRDGSETTRDPP